jgi:D-glycero-alpha-D-manno-heptose 1-phosphate guanylyltransferase
MFEAVILAGGKGTRLKEVTGDLPKPMVEVSGQPFLYLLMKRLESQGCTHIVLSLCYQAELIINRVLKDKPVTIPVNFSIEETPLGTGGAIKLAATQINSDNFIALNGDTYSEVNYAEVFAFLNTSDLVICGVEVNDVSRYGTLKVDEADNVLGFYEKGRQGSGLINSGCYVINKTNIISVDKVSFSFEQDYVETFVGVFKAHISSGYFIDIGIPEDYFKACERLK